MAKYRCKYEYCLRFGRPRHTWSAVGAAGGVHLSINDYGEKHELEYGERYGGGLEFHSRTPIHGDGPPDHDQCWLLHAPCWHDGSSLVVTEEWIPMWLEAPYDHDSMFQRLSRAADRWFSRHSRDQE